VFVATGQGELVLENTADGVKHCFTLRGKGDKPLPIDTISLKMTARQQYVKPVSCQSLLCSMQPLPNYQAN